MSALTHPQARARLQAAADGRLNSAEQLELAAHLAACAECRAYAADLAALEAALPRSLQAHLEAAPLPGALPERVRARLKDKPRPSRFYEAVTTALGAGALLVLAAVFAWALGGRPAESGQPLSGGAGTTAQAAAPTQPPLPSPDFTQQPLRFFPALTYDGVGALIGYSVAPLGERGLIVALLWEGLRADGRAVMVFVHLADSAGQLVAQSDSPLSADDQAQWASGQYLSDAHRLELPADLPPGQYRVSVGVYDPATGARVAGVEAQGAAYDEATLGLLDWPLPPNPTLPPPGTPTPWLATPTPCQAGCPEATLPPLLTPTPTAFLSLDLSATPFPTRPPTLTPLPASATPAPPEPQFESATPFPTLTDTPTPYAPPLETQPTPIPGDPTLTATATPWPFDTPAPTPTPCQVGCPEPTATPLPTMTPLPTPSP